jgi:hypothetical protein
VRLTVAALAVSRTFDDNSIHDFNTSCLSYLNGTSKSEAAEIRDDGMQLTDAVCKLF